MSRRRSRLQRGKVPAPLQPGQQHAEVKPLTAPPGALLAAVYRLEPLTQGVAAAMATVDRLPRPQAEPPHTILHCCWRI